MSGLGRRLQQAGVSPMLYLSPAKGSFITGNNFTVQIRENSGGVAVNSIQANLTYPSALLQYVSANTTGSPFTTTAQNTGGSGVVNLAVGILGDSVTGDALVGTVTFKVLAAGTATIAFDTGSGVASAATNANVCQAELGAKYTLS